MAPRAEKGTAGSANGEHAVPNKEQSFIFKIPRNLSLIAKRSFLIVIRSFQRINNVIYAYIDLF